VNEREILKCNFFLNYIILGIRSWNIATFWIIWALSSFKLNVIKVKIISTIDFVAQIPNTIVILVK
jgi:hypothetical protein